MIQEGELFPHEVRAGDVIGVRIDMDICTGRITAVDGPARVRMLRVSRNPQGQVIVLDSNQQVYTLTGYTYELYERDRPDDDWREPPPGPPTHGRDLPQPTMRALPPPQIHVECKVLPMRAKVKR